MAVLRGLGLRMFDAFKPTHSPKRLWLALVVIAAIGLVGILLEHMR